MRQKTGLAAFGIAVFLYLANGNSYAAESIRVTDAAVDNVTLSADRISRDQSIHVQLFNSADAYLGKPKHRDTAELLARSAPHLLAVDIVEALRDAGFSDVMLDEAAESSAKPHLVLAGKITELNPGSQAARAWIGFGSGKSKVCVEGHVSDAAGTILANFSHCRNGLGWGDSSSQLADSAVRVGDSIATFLTAWANGQYAQ
ncbi:MAG: hypothetical protein DRR11_02475 [Gammaproteobacteria bacterium]|nr:MAG: hypothetical protein DRR11_02475 [Gammaproteobacteria bacterium]RLA35861.1 MAG: hypothetical protein DRR15_06335 [Gammaproteobacteria bacterium]